MVKINIKYFLSKNFIQILQIAIDIKNINAVQTGANTQLGGLKLGRYFRIPGSLKNGSKPPNS